MHKQVVEGLNSVSCRESAPHIALSSDTAAIVQACLTTEEVQQNFPNRQL